VIEERIAASAQPSCLVVISNDRRVQEAARRKGAAPWTSDDYLAHAETRDQATKPAGSPKPERQTPSHEDVQHWLAEFGDLADDPDFREVFERFPFED